MLHIVESDKSFYEVCLDLEPVVQRLGFVVLHAGGQDVLLRPGEHQPDDECSVFAIGNYRQNEQLLAIDMRLCLLLPWRIAVFTDNGATKIGLLRPTALLGGFAATPRLAALAGEIEERMLQIVDEVR